MPFLHLQCGELHIVPLERMETDWPRQAGVSRGGQEDSRG